MREIRSSGSAEGVMGNCDPYSDPPEPLVVKQPKSTPVEGADTVMQSCGIHFAVKELGESGIGAEWG
jgi:hypothetical protein